MYLMIQFLCIELKKLIVSEIFFNYNKYFFSTGTLTTNKLDDGSGLQVLVLETVLKLQANSMADR